MPENLELVNYFTKVCRVPSVNDECTAGELNGGFCYSNQSDVCNLDSARSGYLLKYKKDYLTDLTMQYFLFLNLGIWPPNYGLDLVYLKPDDYYIESFLPSSGNKFIVRTPDGATHTRIETQGIYLVKINSIKNNTIDLNVFKTEITNKNPNLFNSFVVDPFVNPISTNVQINLIKGKENTIQSKVDTAKPELNVISNNDGKYLFYFKDNKFTLELQKSVFDNEAEKKDFFLVNMLPKSKLGNQKYVYCSKLSEDRLSAEFYRYSAKEFKDFVDDIINKYSKRE